MMFNIGVIGLHNANKINRHHLRALMNSLEKSVLNIGANSAPHHRAGFVVDGRAIAADTFTVRLHFQLL